MSSRRGFHNIGRVVEAARLLGELTKGMVFVGGAVVDLLLDDPGAPVPRPTLDIDVIVEAATRTEYYRLQEKLREKGFRESQEDNVICRWVHGSLILDVMPADESLLGFSNRWYRSAFVDAQEVHLEGIRISVISAPVFLATKQVAFFDRGQADYTASQDMEDIIAVIDGRKRIVDEVATSAEEIREFVSSTFKQLLEENDFVDAIAGHLPPDPASQQRFTMVLEKIQRIASLEK